MGIPSFLHSAQATFQNTYLFKNDQSYRLHNGYCVGNCGKAIPFQSLPINLDYTNVSGSLSAVKPNKLCQKGSFLFPEFSPCGMWKTNTQPEALVLFSLPKIGMMKFNHNRVVSEGGVADRWSLMSPLLHSCLDATERERS